MTANVTDIETAKRSKATATRGDIRHDWTRAEALALYDLPFMDLLFRAQTVHRATSIPTACR